MICPNCKCNDIEVICAVCTESIAEVVILDKEEAQLVFDRLKIDWIPIDYPHKDRAKGLFTKLRKVVTDSGT